MSSSRRSTSRHRASSPSSRRRRHSRTRDRSQRSRSPSEDRHRHRSSSHRHHRSTRHDDRSNHESSRHSRHRDHVSSSETRSSVQQQSDSGRKDDARPTEVAPDIVKPDKSPSDASKDSKKDSSAVETESEKEKKQRERRERLEAWKRKKAEESNKPSEAAIQQEKEASETGENGTKSSGEQLSTATPLMDDVKLKKPDGNQTTHFDTSKINGRELVHTTENNTLPTQNGATNGDHSHFMDIDAGDEDSMEIDQKLVNDDQSSKNGVSLSTGAVNSKPKPANKMLIGFGRGKTMMKKPNTTLAKTKTKKPETVKEDQPMEEADQPDVDPLEAYMQDMEEEVSKIKDQDLARMQEIEKAGQNRSLFETDDQVVLNNDEEDEEIGSDPEDILAAAAKKIKRKELATVDHSKIDYEPFEKEFYIEPPELREMTKEEVDVLRLDLDGIKVRGKKCPKPITKWSHCGLPVGCLEVVRKLNFERPTSIQSQAIPAIMSGRDAIGVAKTGSGKTLAFLLPMFRHIKAQRPLEAGEGPIAVIMSPTRELATQIHLECKPFLKKLGLRAVCAYGGSPIKDQIAELKRGCEIVVCTPGRMIDLLCANAGRVTNLTRATYLVLDEADRMFDMGFEPQVMKIINNVRPTRQTVLFSATFPRYMEALARKVLKKPVEITVGGRSVVCEDVTQIVEIREESSRFGRLLEILGELYKDESAENCRALVFVDKQEAADGLFVKLMQHSYTCQSLHGGKEQMDRDSIISDFKNGIFDVLVATSVAARGLDVKQLKLVVNYDCPNHMEDYVHRVGRTGRAGNKGTSYTFIIQEQEERSLGVRMALKNSEQEIPEDLEKMVQKFQAKVKSGEKRMVSGFGGKGLDRFDLQRAQVKMIQDKTYRRDDDERSDEEEEKTMSDDEDEPMTSNSVQSEPTPAPVTAPAKSSAAETAKQIVQRMVAEARQKEDAKKGITAAPSYRFELNDYPQKARYNVLRDEKISEIQAESGAALFTKGVFCPPGKELPSGVPKIHLLIEGTEQAIKIAKNLIKKVLQIETEIALSKSGPTTGRYNVL